MQDFLNTPVRSKTAVGAKRFNYNKLQAVLCIMSSSLVSVALIIWAFKSLL